MTGDLAGAAFVPPPLAANPLPTVLAIDTSTERLGVALLHGEACAVRHLQLGTGHANHVLGLVEELLRETGVTRAQVDGIAVCRGPGGFTGLRIAMGVAQGLALALDRPVVPVSGLRVLAAAAVPGSGPESRHPSPHEAQSGPVLAVIDARMGEFYAAGWAGAGAARTGEAPLLAEALWKPEALLEQAVPFRPRWQLVGPGVPALLAACAALDQTLPCHAESTWPDAGVLAMLGRQGLLAGEGVPAEAAQPVYLRDQVAVPSVRPVSSGCHNGRL